MLKSINNLTANQKGAMLVLALAATGLFLAITLGAVGLATMQRKLNISKVARAQASHSGSGSKLLSLGALSRQ